jgi:hypothetical protein
MKLTNLTNFIMIYTLKLFNTGQITLPKVWRSKFKTKNFIAQETKDGLLIKPLVKDDLVYYENDDEFGIYCENGIDVEKFKKAIKKIHG